MIEQVKEIIELLFDLMLLMAGFGTIALGFWFLIDQWKLDKKNKRPKGNCYCYQCKYWTVNYLCEYFGRCSFSERNTWSDDFCSSGERK